MIDLIELLNAFENTSITSPLFVETKVKIQEEIQRLADGTAIPSVRTELLAMHMQWRKLGVDGTLSRYSEAVADLKVAIGHVDTAYKNAMFRKPPREDS